MKTDKQAARKKTKCTPAEWRQATARLNNNSIQPPASFSYWLHSTFAEQVLLAVMTWPLALRTQACTILVLD
jgi:hypothetical protein